MEERIKKTIANLQKNNMQATYAPTKEKAVEIALSLLHEGDTVAVGGSVTLQETGMLQELRSGKYRFLDRYAPGLTPEEREEIYRSSMSTDAFFCSSNAVTENGELYNVDGHCNRIAAIAFGPKKVIMLVGINKIVPNMDAAIRRVKTIAAPKNTVRLSCNTYCAQAGQCMGLNGEMTDGCHASGRICCSYLVSAYQQVADRIHVILIGEQCGY